MIPFVLETHCRTLNQVERFKQLFAMQFHLLTGDTFLENCDSSSNNLKALSWRRSFCEINLFPAGIKILLKDSGIRFVDSVKIGLSLKLMDKDS